jgi:hypothetical protein
VLFWPFWAASKAVNWAVLGGDLSRSPCFSAPEGWLWPLSSSFWGARSVQVQGPGQQGSPR